jgi:transcription elongation GreA/GreB family factor
MHKDEKASILAACKALLETRMEEAKVAMLAAQESANSNEKSSMGDKYETGRAMGQLDRDMHAKQLALLQDEYAKLLKVNISVQHKIAETGALVQTETQQYWIAVSLGQVLVENNKIMVVSPQSPIAKSMLQKKKGDRFEVNGKKQKIIAVF